MTYLAIAVAFAWGDIPEKLVDWSFVGAQEAFVVESVGLPAAYRSLSPESRSLLASMGEDDWRHREWASRQMERSGDVRACFVGQRLDDPEIRLRCRNVLRRLSSCSMCSGRGVTEETWGAIECRVCRGVGHFWPPEDF